MCLSLFEAVPLLVLKGFYLPNDFGQVSQSDYGLFFLYVLVSPFVSGSAQLFFCDSFDYISEVLDSFV